eukprot:tig00000985_g6006.t1
MSIISLDDDAMSTSSRSASPTPAPITGPSVDEFVAAVEAVSVPRDATLRSTFPGLSEKAERDLLDAVRAMRGDVTHLLDLKALFETISKANLRLKPSKCRFCVPEIDLLGHRISAEGIRQDPAKTKVITDWQTPKNADELRSFLGLAGYYRRFVENFSKVHLRIGAILSQADDKGVERPLAFISRTLLPAEMNYSATELECLAVVWAIKYWRHYLLGGPQFLVRTDHHALQWLKTLDPTTGRLGRWSLLLQAYDFEIVLPPWQAERGSRRVLASP